MYVIVVGCGRVGSQVGTILSTEGHDVVVVDILESSFRRLGSVFNGVAMVGNGFDEEVLREAGAERADAFTAVTNLDNTNIMSAQIAKRIFKIPRVVARLYNPERELTYKRLGLDVICGTTLVANRIKNKILQEHFMSHLSLGSNGEIEIIEFKAGEFMDGKRIDEVEVPGELRIVSVAGKENAVVPQKDTILEKDNMLVASVKTASMKKFFDKFGLKNNQSD
ncbi:MAG: TrkA family potassium uptake protein [Actinobacteria bacterium]|nr:TrkA family potassium uptake protein [Actinomycetota bacterium]